MKNSRKLDKCLNCGKQLSKSDNFCSNCGQENIDQKVSILRFVKDFISNYLNFETVFFQTLPAFFLHPGKLTNTFNEGKRKKYIHPIRLYLISSLFYFFVAALAIPKDVVDRIMSESINPEQINQDSGGMVKFNFDAGKKLDSLNKSGRLDELKELGLNLDSTQMNASDLEDINKIIEDSINRGKRDWRELRKLAVDLEIPDSAFDTAISKTSFNIFPGLGSEQRRRFVANSGLFISSAIQNLPIMMFLLLPLFAFFLRILYFRTGKFYVEHLIHGLHLHSFAYLIYGLGILWMFETEIGVVLVYFISFIWVSTYAYLSLLNVSKQGWFKTLLKFWVLGLFYFITLFVATLLELYISLITF
ncbi:DUF3667 domain-containing protein [Algoriphagus sp.]|uniref:DUF3667 domain-containing protein n=1 Tax=Algoriphagus sp. TaxID=1872435 RepID=UPI0025D63BCD|nr:DUF3667 domain-containing protein [Algoriphagus sp.]